MFCSFFAVCAWKTRRVPGTLTIFGSVIDVFFASGYCLANWISDRQNNEWTTYDDGPSQTKYYLFFYKNNILNFITYVFKEMGVTYTCNLRLHYGDASYSIRNFMTLVSTLREIF